MSTNPTSKISHAVLKLAATKPWRDVTLVQIAQAAKLPLAQVEKLYPTPNNILPDIIAMIDSEVEKVVGKIDCKASAHDRLFEVMMARFDILQEHRAGILSIASAARQQPDLIQPMMKAQWHSMQNMLACAGVLEKSKPHAMAQMAGLLIVYNLVLYSWNQDDAEDMAKTMAVLDRSLKQAGKLAEILLQKN